MTDFPIRLKEIRTQKRLSQKQISNAIGITDTLYQKYEYGKTKPAYDIIVKLCLYFDISADYLLGLSEEQTRH